MAQNDNANLNRDWSFDVNLAGLNAPNGQSNREIPEGFYKVKVTDMFIGEDKPNRVIIRLQVNDGPYVGATKLDGLNLPKDESDNVRYYWRALAESCGYTPAQLDKGEVNLKRDSFMNRVGHIRYTPKNEAKGVKYEDVVWLSPTEWSQQKQGFETGTAATATTTATTTATATATAGTGGNTVAKKDVAAQLGLG